MGSKVNLRSSLFGNYCFGMYTERHIQLFNDLYQIEEQIPPFQLNLMKYGTKHEKHGVAEFINWFGQVPENILSEQLNLVVPVNDDVVLSSTPDGFCMDGNALIEVKCTKIKKQTKPKFDARWLPQVFGQMLVVNHYYRANKIDKKIDKTFLVNWAEKDTKIYMVQRNDDAIDLIKELLMNYGQTFNKMSNVVKNLPDLIDLEDNQKEELLSTIQKGLRILPCEELRHAIMEQALENSVELVYEASI